MKKIARLPINCDEELLRLLKNHQVSYHRKNKIKTIRNVFVTFDGLVIKNGLLVLGCAFNLLGMRDKTFYFQFWKIAFEKKIVSKLGRSIPSVVVDDTLGLVHSKWFNYAFWINSYLPRLFELIETNKEFKLIYPENWDDIPYVKQVIDELPVKKYHLPEDHQVFAKKLMMPQTRKWTSSFDERRINLVRKKLIEISNLKLVDHEFPKKIYITRKNRGNRCAENEEEILFFLGKLGYKAIALEDYTIWEQIQMMSEVTHLISIHGAGLTNLIFLKEGAKVLELVNRQYAQKEYTFPFWKLAQTIDVEYYIQLCDAVNQKGHLGFGKLNKNKRENDFLVNSNLNVDLRILKENVITYKF